MNYLSAIAAIVQKDSRTELRTKEMVASMFVFSVLVLLIFNFTLSLDGQTTLELAPALGGVLVSLRRRVLVDFRVCALEE